MSTENSQQLKHDLYMSASEHFSTTEITSANLTDSAELASVSGCCGTAGSFGSVCGCAGTFGTFGCFSCH